MTTVHFQENLPTHAHDDARGRDLLVGCAAVGHGIAAEGVE
jgi:hypothetical protein